MCSDLPCKLYAASVTVSSTGDVVYVTAGDAPDDKILDNVYCYNINTDHWSVLPQPGHNFGVLNMLDDRLTIFGGQDPVTFKFHSKVTTYNNDTNSWYSQYPDMLNNRLMSGVIVYRNYVIVMGGKSGPNTCHDSIEVMEYHDELQWKVISLLLPVAMWGIKPTISGDNIVIVGYDTTGGGYAGHYEITIDEIISSLDQPLSTGAVSTKWKEMLHATHWDTVTVPYSNPPVIIGGHSHDNQGSVHTSDVTLYDVSKNSWRKVDSLTTARSDVGVALLSKNTIIVIGGTTGGTDIEGAMASCITTVEVGNIVLNY